MRLNKQCLLILVILILASSAHKSNAQIVVVKKPIKPGIVFVKKPKPGINYFWVEPHWEWNYPLKRYRWVQGHWEKKRNGFRYVPGHWVKTRKGYKWIPGKWRRIRKQKING